MNCLSLFDGIKSRSFVHFFNCFFVGIGSGSKTIHPPIVSIGEKLRIINLSSIIAATGFSRINKTLADWPFSIGSPKIIALAITSAVPI